MDFPRWGVSISSFCACLVTLAQTPSLAPASGGIAGVVLEGDNAPVRQAIVTLSSVETSPQDAVAWTDGNGRFLFSNLPAGRYQLRASKSGYEPAVYGSKTARIPAGIIKLGAGEVRSDFTFHLLRMSSISGMVVDEDGDPVGGVQIMAMTPGFKRQKRALLPGPSTITDTNGRYQLAVDPGQYVVAASQDYGRPVLRVNPEVSADHAGQVDRPFPNQIWPFTQPEYSYGSQFYARTDRADSAAALDVQAAQEVSSIDFQLAARPNVPLRGKVVLPVGVKSVTNVAIAVIKEDLADRAYFVDMGAGPPDYVFQNLLPSGSYRLAAHVTIDGRNYRGVQNIDLGPLALADVMIALEPGVDISGRVSVEGPDAQKHSASFVSLVPGDGNGYEGVPLRANVNNDGSFKIHEVPPGIWDINVGPIPPDGYLKSMHLGNQDVLTEDMAIRSSTTEQLNIVLSTRAANIEGDVMEGDQPASAVVLLAPEGKFRHVLSFYRAASADDKGHFEIKGAARGRYKLLAFDEFDEGSIQAPEFLKPFESAGVAVELREGSNSAPKLIRIVTRKPNTPSEAAKPQSADATRQVLQ